MDLIFKFTISRRQRFNLTLLIRQHRIRHRSLNSTLIQTIAQRTNFTIFSFDYLFLLFQKSLILSLKWLRLFFNIVSQHIYNKLFALNFLTRNDLLHIQITCVRIQTQRERFFSTD